MQEFLNFISVYGWQTAAASLGTCFLIGVIVKPISRKLITNAKIRHIVYLVANAILTFGIAAIIGLATKTFNVNTWWQLGLASYTVLGVAYKLYETLQIKTFVEDIIKLIIKSFKVDNETANKITDEVGKAIDSICEVKNDSQN